MQHSIARGPTVRATSIRTLGGLPRPSLAHAAIRQPTGGLIARPSFARDLLKHQVSRQQQPQAQRRSATVVAQAASGGVEIERTSPVKIGGLVLAWYASNIIFNIANKNSLTAFPCPWFISTLQLAVSGVYMIALWVLGLQKKPKVDAKFWKMIMPVAFFHTVGHVSACTSFGQMAVSFAHIVKSAEPVFSVALTGPILGDSAPIYVWLSLLPIVAGCGLSAMKEVSFAWNGFTNAMLSNVGMVLRNIYSKKALGDYKDADIDGMNLFGLIAIAALVFCVPLAVVMEGSKWGAAYQGAISKVGKDIFLRDMALAGLFYHLYNQFSYMVLDQRGVNPVTLSVGNTMKRVAVVVSSVLFFKNPVSALNWIGSSIAIFGTFLYSLASDKAKKEKAAAAVRPAAA